MGRYEPKKKIRVWKTKKPPYEVNKDGFTIYDLPKTANGWIDARIYRPIRFELVKAKTQEKIKYVWWDGFKWVGYRLRPYDQILAWNISIHNTEVEDDEESQIQNPQGYERIQTGRPTLRL